ncbi:MAG: YraN family protein [Cryomorphaceae bacterium]|nr:YraN family protein [Flavobacteriales bacterium]
MSNSTNIQIGNEGESRASTHMESLGFKIRERNWRHGHDEIDIIAENETFIVFTEVKTRQSNAFGEPEAFVTRKKQSFMIRAANTYITRHNIEKEARFDIIAITLNQADGLVHIPDAFYPIV